MKREIFKTKLGEKELKVEINDMAEQASGSVLVQYGDTTVLATACMSDKDKEGIDFFPLTVEYEERYYAAGKILGSRYMRRESRPSDEAILTSRFIDRAIRPRFPKHLKREVQVIITCLSWDGENDPDIIGLLAASLALSISNIPWSGPVAAARAGLEDLEKDNFTLNPTYQERENNKFDLAVAGLETKELIINMIEMEGNEVQEDVFLKAVDFLEPVLKQLLDFQKDIINKVAKEKVDIPEPEKDLELEKDIREFLGDKLDKAIYLKDKTERNKTLGDLKDNLLKFIEDKYSESKQSYINSFLEEEINNIIHANAIKFEKRPDGRKLDEIRDISANVSLLPRTHGSGLFARGQTKSLSILTLGAPGDFRLLEGMETITKKRFMHHYNFPPYSAGEVKPVRGPGRREIGHGMLAEKALAPLVPNFDQFPYTIRIVTEIMSSNGSTSMAAVSSSSLALMDAGVPIKRPATGIAMGLMSNEDDYKILTDIQGPEDHYGDMDFKVAGTTEGMCAVQLDVKIAGINKEIIKSVLERAKKARLHILDVITKTIDKPRTELSPYAPRILILQINPDKIREVIGPGGKVINEIIDECGVSIDIEDSGKVFVTAEKEEAARKAMDWIKNITREVKVGEVFQGKVKRILDFGAFIEILPGQEGLAHISQLADYRVEKVGDVVKIDDIVPVKVISIDEQGRINLSIKQAK